MQTARSLRRGDGEELAIEKDGHMLAGGCAANSPSNSRATVDHSRTVDGLRDEHAWSFWCCHRRHQKH